MPVARGTEDGLGVGRDDGLDELRFLLCAMAHRVKDEVEEAEAVQS